MNSSLFDDLLKDVRREQINVKIALSLESMSATHVDVFVHDLRSKAAHYRMYCQKMMDYLLAKGLTVYVARNADNEIMPYLHRQDAEAWLADNPGTGTVKHSIETLQMSLSPEIPHE